jgi:hypothetical protein
MLRRIQALAIATILVVAAFSSGWNFLFYLLYLAILVVGGSYVLVRLGLSDLEAGYAVSQLHGHLHPAQQLADPQAVARDPQPDDPARWPAGQGHHPRRPQRAVVAHPGSPDPPRALPHRAAPYPDR